MHLDDTNPYPWPYDGDLRGPRLAMLVLGAQHGWAAVSTGVGEVRTATLRAMDAVAAAGGRLVLVRHGVPVLRRCSDRPPPVPVVGSDAWSLDATLRAGRPSALVVDAAGLDAFFGSVLDPVLRAEGRDHLVLAGYASELTVDTTVRGANDRGYECLVLTDACAPVDPEVGARAHASVTMSGGIFGALGSTDALEAALAADVEPVPVA
ncbi:MAG: isochorismatase family cysteine hydrolase [Acidimicrobiales bacterium]